MKNNRDMFYGNYNMGAFKEPTFTPPSGYNITGEYQAFGPNANSIPMQTNPYEERITAIERQIRNLDQRIRKLETIGNNSSETEINDSNLYMI